MKKLCLLILAMVCMVSNAFASSAMYPFDEDVSAYLAIVDDIKAQGVIVEADFDVPILEEGDEDVVITYTPFAGGDYKIIYKDEAMVRCYFTITDGTYAWDKLDYLLPSFVLVHDSESEDEDAAYAVVEYLVTTMAEDERSTPDLKIMRSSLDRADGEFAAGSLITSIFPASLSFYFEPSVSADQ